MVERDVFRAGVRVVGLFFLMRCMYSLFLAVVLLVTMISGGDGHQAATLWALESNGLFLLAWFGNVLGSYGPMVLPVIINGTLAWVLLYRPDWVTRRIYGRKIESAFPPIAATPAT